MIWIVMYGYDWQCGGFVHSVWDDFQRAQETAKHLMSLSEHKGNDIVIDQGTMRNEVVQPHRVWENGTTLRPTHGSHAAAP